MRLYLWIPLLVAIVLAARLIVAEYLLMINSTIGNEKELIEPIQEPKVRSSCSGGSLVWFTSFKESSSPYSNRNHLKVALTSARQNSPSLKPYLLWDGSPDETTDWFEASGGRVIYHKLSFDDQLKQHLDKQQYVAVASSYLAYDAAAFFQEILTSEIDLDVDTTYFLYTEPTVMFLNDVNSCVLLPSKPPFYAIGTQLQQQRRQEQGDGSALDDELTSPNILYINGPAFTEYRYALMKFAASTEFQIKGNTPATSDALLSAFTKHRHIEVTNLPDAMNWKPYWGTPAGGVSVVGGTSSKSTVRIIDWYRPSEDDDDAHTEDKDDVLACLLEGVYANRNKCSIDPQEMMQNVPDEGTYYKLLIDRYRNFLTMAGRTNNAPFYTANI